MALTEDEKKLLADLSKKAEEPDADDDFEIEVYDTTAGRGARIPFKRGKNWLYDNFGIGDNPNPETEKEETKDEVKKTPAGYFNRK
jgi:hypothetical protein